MGTSKSTLVVDTEVYVNYFLVMFKSTTNGVTRAFEMFEGQPLDTGRIEHILGKYRVVTFNGTGYDMPMLTLALSGVSCKQLKRASDAIIVGQVKPWAFYSHYEIEPLRHVDHVDLMEVAVGQGSLKLYGGRLHSKRLQDLPIEPDACISPADRALLKAYCSNDLNTTHDLLDALGEQIALRERMTKQYGIDLRSKSDAQIAEAVIKLEVGKMLGTKVGRPIIPPGTTFKYEPPDFISFRTEALRQRLAAICAAGFVIGPKGSPIEPAALVGVKERIGQGVYRMGIGGLHSSEERTAHHASDDVLLIDFDVQSYYPSIILKCGLYPEHLTEAFLAVYRYIFNARIAAKKAGDKVTSDVFKIVLNSSYGKLGSRWSPLYAPDLMIQVTVTGQLALLMLIEALELDGIAVVSANTDGIMLKFPAARYDDVKRHIRDWEARTGFVMEETRYKAVYSQSVNAYIAIKDGGGVKGKGPFAGTSLAKSPQNAICTEALKAFLEHGTPIERYIRECDDIRKFVTVRRVNGGATYRGAFLGKVVRWYYGTGRTDSIHYAKATKAGTFNKVASSDGAVPLMDLPDSFPKDVDFERYVGMTYQMLHDVGAL